MYTIHNTNATVITMICHLINNEPDVRLRQQFCNKCYDEDYIMDKDVIEKIERCYGSVLIKNGKITDVARYQVMNKFNRDAFFRL